MGEWAHGEIATRAVILRNGEADVYTIPIYGKDSVSKTCLNCQFVLTMLTYIDSPNFERLNCCVLDNFWETRHHNTRLFR